MWGLTSIALIIALHSWLAVSATAQQPEEKPGNYDIERLPSNVIPRHYTLDLKVNLPGYYENISKEEEFTFSGRVEIDIFVTEPTKIVKLNVAKTLLFQSALLITVTPESENGNWTTLDNFKIDDNVEIMTIKLEEELLPAIPYKLVIFFDGQMTHDGLGFYYVKYNGSRGEEYSAITQFEDIHARKMVPCFDEPSFKATWKLSVVHPMGTHAISNGELLETVDLHEQNNVISVFETSPYMSSYLLALSVSNYIYETGYTQRGIRRQVANLLGVRKTVTPPYRVRGFAHSSLKGKALKNAVNYSIKSIEKLEELFDYAPTQKKLDFVVTPSRFAGMENWDMITYGDDMLYTENLRDFDIETIAHEVTHQWFGNLVTAEWWSEIWLNEGLTSYVTCYIAEHLRKEMTSAECLFEMQEVSLSKSNVLVPEVDQRDEIDSQFDTVYEKGGSLARMIEEIIGYNNMMEGLKKYIDDNLYGNVDRYDLVDALQSFTDVNLTRLVDQWSTQVGYPIVHVERIERTIFKLTQTVAAENGTSAQKFDIPIFIKDSKSDKIPIFKADDDHMFVMTDGEYPIINGNNAGGYRVDYGRGWDKMNRNLKLSPMERSKLIKDLVAIHMFDPKRGNTAEDSLEFPEPYGQQENSRMVKQSLGKRKQRM